MAILQGTGRKEDEENAREAGNSGNTPARSTRSTRRNTQPASQASNPVPDRAAMEAYSRSNRVDESPNKPGTARVDQSIIDQIMEMGMVNALELAQSGQASPQFLEAVRRFYLGTGEAANREGVAAQRNERDSFAESQAARVPEGGSNTRSAGPANSAPSGSDGPKPVATEDTVPTFQDREELPQIFGGPPSVVNPANNADPSLGPQSPAHMGPDVTRGAPKEIMGVGTPDLGYSSGAPKNPTSGNRGVPIPGMESGSPKNVQQGPSQPVPPPDENELLELMRALAPANPFAQSPNAQPPPPEPERPNGVSQFQPDLMGQLTGGGGGNPISGLSEQDLLRVLPLIMEQMNNQNRYSPT